MDTFLICLVIIIAAFAIALFVWWLFKPKRESVVLIRPFKTRPNITHKQGSGFGLDLGDRVVEKDSPWQHAAAVREQIYQNQQAAARRAAEQNRQDEQSAYSTSYHRSEPSCHSSSDSGSSSYSSSSSDSSSSSSCDSGSSSSSSSSD